jgi:hypothetical protein
VLQDARLLVVVVVVVVVGVVVVVVAAAAAAVVVSLFALSSDKKPYLFPISCLVFPCYLFSAYQLRPMPLPIFIKL